MRRFWADALVVAHFLWVAFMVGGFVVQMAALKSARLRDWTFVRLAHVGGILYVAGLILLGAPCPLTVWEACLRSGSATESPPSFLVNWLERLIYPDVDPLIVYVPTVVLAVVSLVAVAVSPPAAVRRRLSGTDSSQSPPSAS